MQFLWLYIDDLMGKGLSYLVIAELLMYASSTLVNLALPMAILLSSIMTFGAMAESSELVAMKASGMPLIRIMWPLTVLVIFMTVGAFLFANYVTPVAYLKWRTLLYDVTEKKPAMSIQPKMFFNGFDGYSIRVLDKNTETGELTDVLIYDHSDDFGGNRRVIRAKRGKMDKWNDGKSLVLSLEDGYSYEEIANSPLSKGSLPNVTTRFEKQQLVIDLSDLAFKRSDESIFKSGYKMLNVSQLSHVRDSITGIEGEGTKKIDNYIGKTFKVANDSLALNHENKAVDSAQTQKVTINRAIADRAINILNNAKLYVERQSEHSRYIKEQNRRYGVEVHRKFTFSLACLILFFLGAPLGAIIRKGGLGLPVVFAVIFFLIFHVLSITGEKMAVAGVAPIGLGMWMNIMSIAPISLWLTIKANQDSALFDAGIFKKLRQLFTFKKSKN